MMSQSNEMSELDGETIAGLIARKEEIERRLRAWDYPPRGSITASCGHRVYGGDTGECVSHWDWGDHGDLVEYYSCFCPWCALHTKVSGRYIPGMIQQEAA